MTASDHLDEREISRAFDRIVALTPELGGVPARDRDQSVPSRRRAVIAAAAVLATVGVSGLVLLNGPSADDRVATAPTASGLPAVTSAATTPPGDASVADPADAVALDDLPLLPILDDAALGGLAVAGYLHDLGASVRYQTAFTVARVAADGSVSDPATVVVGPGVDQYLRGFDVPDDLTVPYVTTIGDLGYATWNIGNFPVLVMGADAGALAQDPGFELAVTSDEEGELTVDVASLPPGYQVLVPAASSERRVATARLLVGPNPDGDLVTASVLVAVLNPLNNLNLTEGATITPTAIGEQEGWLVTAEGTTFRALVWSPDGETWILFSRDLQAQLTDDEMDQIAATMTFTDDVAAWIDRYDAIVDSGVVIEPPSTVGD
ncbi:MAG: hypothetical protein ACK5OX_11295 [Desertimonas sp.]